MPVKLLSGRSHPQLANDLNIPPVAASFHTFTDQEIAVEVLEPLQDIALIILQSTPVPVNDTLMELFLMIDAAKRAGAKDITVIAPYLGYARQDKTAAGLIAHFFNSSSIKRLITIDLHTPEILNFFSIPIIHLTPTAIFAADIQAQHQDVLIVGPDRGAISRAEALAKQCQTEFIFLEKQRHHQSVLKQTPNLTGKTCILVDDIIDSGHTLCQAAKTLESFAPKAIHAYVSHGLLSPYAVDRLNNSAIRNLTLLNTLEFSRHSKIRELSIVPMLSQILRENFIIEN